MMMMMMMMMGVDKDRRRYIKGCDRRMRYKGWG